MNRYNFVLPNLVVKSYQLGKVSTDTATPLPDNFIPCPSDVMCGRGKKCAEHNVHFRCIIDKYLAEYSAAPSKPEKSRIVSTVFDEITSKGQFVRYDNKNKRWSSVPEGTSREKISQGFRDCLTDQYRSSKDCRQRKRKQAREELKSCESSFSADEQPLAKKARPASPPTSLLKTSDALQQLLAFSQQMSNQSTPRQVSISEEEQPQVPDTVDSSDPFEPFSIGLEEPSFERVESDFRASRRMFGSCSSIVIDFESEEFVAARSA